MKPIIKFNQRGAGAVLCSQCRIIVDCNFNQDEIEVLSVMSVPCYCKECNMDGYKKFNKGFFNALEEYRKNENKDSE